MKKQKNSKVEFDYSKLQGRIVEKVGTKSKFTELMGCAFSTISLTLNNHREFTQNEIVRAAKILDIKTEDVPKYFFTPKNK